MAEDKKGDEFDDDPIRKYFRSQREKADGWTWRSDRRSRFQCRGCDKEVLVVPGFPPISCSYCNSRDFDYKGGRYV